MTIKKKKKLVGESTPSNVVRPKVNVIDEYYSMKAFGTHVMTEFALQQLCDRMLNWAALETSIVAGEFLSQEGIDRPTHYRWLKKFPIYNVFWEQLKVQVGERRERLALLNRLNPQVVLQMMALYNKEYKDFLRWKSEVIKEKPDEAKVFNVFLTKPEIKRDSDESIALEVQQTNTTTAQKT